MDAMEVQRVWLERMGVVFEQDGSSYPSFNESRVSKTQGNHLGRYYSAKIKKVSGDYVLWKIIIVSVTCPNGGTAGSSGRQSP